MPLDRDVFGVYSSHCQISQEAKTMRDSAVDELREMHEEPVIDEMAMRALRKIWLEAVMVESFDQAADLIQSALIPD